MIGVGSGRGGRFRRHCGAALCLCLAAWAAASCSRPSPPPGGKPDRTPPQVIAVQPEPMAVVEGWDRPVVFRFNERISERGIDQVVLVSPETGEVEVDKGRSDLEISLDGGWHPGEVYRIELAPGIQDLFGNSREEPLELVFSTGPAILPTAVAGDVTDRLTGQTMEGVRVEAVRRADSVTYVAQSDADGIFVHRHLPEGEYALRAYQDRNRNRRPDFFEPQDTAGAVVAAGDTLLFSLALLLPDTTPARLARAEAVDSTHVRLVFDDPLDPAGDLDGVEVRLRRLPDSTEVAVARLMHLHAFAAWQAARRRAEAEQRAAAARDSAVAQQAVAADSVAPDAAATDTTATGAGPAAGEAADDVPDTTAVASQDTAASEPLPARELVVELVRALLPDTLYEVSVSGLENLSGVRDGGGEAAFRTPEPPPADTTASDSVPAAPARPAADSAETAPAGTMPAEPPPELPPDTTRRP